MQFPGKMESIQKPLSVLGRKKASLQKRALDRNKVTNRIFGMNEKKD